MLKKKLGTCSCLLLAASCAFAEDRLDELMMDYYSSLPEPGDSAALGPLIAEATDNPTACFELANRYGATHGPEVTALNALFSRPDGPCGNALLDILDNLSQQGKCPYKLFLLLEAEDLTGRRDLVRRILVEGCPDGAAALLCVAAIPEHREEEQIEKIVAVIAQAVLERTELGDGARICGGHTAEPLGFQFNDFFLSLGDFQSPLVRSAVVKLSNWIKDVEECYRREEKKPNPQPQRCY